MCADLALHRVIDETDGVVAELRDILVQLERGEIAATEALERIPALFSAVSVSTSEACVDIDRQLRCGFPEVVFAPGKPGDLICEIFQTLLDAGQDCLATRVSDEQANVLRRRFSDAIHNPVAATVTILRTTTSDPKRRIAVVSAGSSDRPVAEEAMETARWTGCTVDGICDVGVAGPHRLLNHVQRLRRSSAIVVVAGMEGALPSVVAGHVDCPVIGVPTSVGYGVAFGGVSALLSMLTSCAANVAVVNIDAGFKAGYLAGMIAWQSRSVERDKATAPPDEPSRSADQ